MRRRCSWSGDSGDDYAPRHVVKAVYEGDEVSLQERINLIFPPVSNTQGDTWLEYIAVLPTEGKHDCACLNVGCV